MGYPSLVFLLSQMLTSLPIAQPQFCSNKGTYSVNSAYSKNLNLTLSSLPSNVTAHGGFYNATMGQDPDKVYALALCRGDLSSDTCQNCISYTSQNVTKYCPNQKEATIWGEEVCVIRYSDSNIFATMKTSPSLCVPNPNNISQNFDQFNKTLYDLMENLAIKASSGSPGIKFATGDEDFTSSRKVYGLLQCTPDISQKDCRICLQGAMEEMEGCSGRKEGGRILRPSCIVWFEVFRFYDPGGNIEDPSPSPPTLTERPPPSPPTLTDRPPGSQGKTSHTIIILVIFVILLTLACAFLLKRRLKKNAERDDAIKRLESLQLDLSTIKTATDDFSDAYKLGQGGFGSVYKGVLPNGLEIAVKRLSGYSAQGEIEFKNEILLVAKLQHRNLVSLIGFCTEGRERILVYEFVRNGSLDHFIFDPIKSTQLNWNMRYKIINGIARGILYLHEDSRLRIIHRDLKASNVLLDEEMNPKISDFGIARLFGLDQTQGITSRAAGTYGYMAPEYIVHNQFSMKSDVFSFGVLLLEIVSGKKNSWLSNSGEVEHLLSHAWKNWREGTASNLIDRTLSGSPRSDMMRCIHIALLCVQESVEDRPTIASVILMLSSHSLSLPLPSQPAFLLYRSTDLNLPSLESDSGTIILGQSTENTEGTTYLSAK